MVCRILNVYNCVNRRSDNYWEKLDDDDSGLFDDSSISKSQADDKRALLHDDFSSSSISKKCAKQLFRLLPNMPSKRTSQGGGPTWAAPDDSESDDEILLFPRGGETIELLRRLSDDDMPSVFDEEASVQFSLDDIEAITAV
eukprot:scaffold6589_cov123-Cylindrotheca_fusiformis.AAC.2